MENWKDVLYQNYVSSGQSNYKDTDILSDYKRYEPYGRYLIRKHLPTNKSIRIIDLGCGTGGYLYQIKNNGYSNISGVDVSVEQVAIAQKAGLNEVIQDDLIGYLLKLDEDSVDVFLLLDVLEHFDRKEAIDLLILISKKLRQGGKLIIHVPNASGIFGSKIRYADLTHELAFTSKSAHQILTATGFSTAATYEDLPQTHSIISTIRLLIWQILTVPFRLIHLAETGFYRIELSQNILIIGTK